MLASAFFKFSPEVPDLAFMKSAPLFLLHWLPIKMKFSNCLCEVKTEVSAFEEAHCMASKKCLDQFLFDIVI